MRVAISVGCLVLALGGASAPPVHAAGTLYSVLHDSANAERLASVTPSTAALSALGTGVAACCGVSDATTIDSQGNVFFWIGVTTADSGTPRLFRFDTLTGADLSAGGVALDTGNSYNYIEWDPASGTLYGLVRPGVTSTERLVRIDPTTGALTNVGAAIANCCSLQTRSSALGGGQLYFAGSLTTDAVNTVRIFSIGLATGAITNDPFLDPGNSYSHLGYDPDTSLLFAMTRNTVGGSEQVARVDTATGTLTPVGAATATCCSTSGTGAYDSASDVFYFTGGFSADSGAIRLMGFSTATGANVSSPVWPAGNNYNFLEFDLAPPAPTGTKTVSGTLTEGGAVTYTIVLANAGSAAIPDNPGNELTDVLPVDLVLVSAAATSGTAATAANTVTWNGSIPASGSVTITIQATIAPGTAGHVVSNQATLAFDSDGNGTNDANALTDDPGVAGPANPTSFTVGALPTQAIPTLGPLGFLLLCAALALLALARLRRRAG